VNAKEYAEFARRTAHPNMISGGGKLNLWLQGPATVEEWEAKSIRVHQEQERRNEEDRTREAAAHRAQSQTETPDSQALSLARA